MRFRNVFLIFVLLFLIGQAIFLFVRAPHLDGVFTVSFWKNLGKVGYVMLLAEETYVSESKAGFDQLGDHALHGLIGGLDSYSSYLTGQEFDDYEMPTRQSYAGIGAGVREVEEGVYIIDLNPAGGALEEGLLPGDWIVEVDEESVVGEGIGEIVKKLRGEPGTFVEVGVRRGEPEEVLRFTVERRELSVDSVRDVTLMEGEIGYLAMRIFGQKTEGELRAAIQQLLDDGMEGLIIDLRNNPGGLLETARDNIELFVPANVKFLTVEARDEGLIEQFFTEDEETVPEDLPIVILQNRFSASASEIMAGALQALGRATVVGEVSFGKGSVQSVFQFNGGDGLSLTTARYVLPDGRMIEGVGLEPDEMIEVSSDEIVQLSVQSSHDLGVTDEEFEAMFGFARIPDRVLDRAVEILKDRIAAPGESSQ